MGIRPVLLILTFLGLTQAIFGVEADSDGVQGIETQLEVRDSVADVYDFLIRIVEDQEPGSPIRIAIDEIGTSQRGFPIIMCTINHSSAGPNAGTGGLMVVARQHGDEPAGAWAMVELMGMIASEPDGNTIEAFSHTVVRIIPVANPDGMETFTRRTANGSDMNRDWNRLRLPETRAIAAAIEQFKPDILLDLHEMTPRDGGHFHMVGLSADKSARLLWTIKEELKSRGLPARTLARERGNSTSLLHRSFPARYGRTALLVESKYSSAPYENIDRRKQYHITVVLASVTYLYRQPQRRGATEP